MAGHSKWANTKRRKASQDAKKNKVRTRMIREIIVAAREGGETNNARLQLAIRNAKKEDVPNDRIDAAIQRAAGGQGENYEEHLYEAYAPHGVALAIETMTDNNRRTVAAVRSVLNKYGGKLVTNNLFSRKGVFTLAKAGHPESEELTLTLLDAGIDTLEEDEEHIYFTCPLQVFSKVQATLSNANVTPQESALQYVPTSEVTLTSEQVTRVDKLIEALEDDDDVQRVYDNMAVAD